MSKEIEFDMVTTRGGDTGDSTSYSGERLPKHDIIFKTVGDIDELSCHLGILKVMLYKSRLTKFYSFIEDVQNTLIRIGGLAALNPKSSLLKSIGEITEKDVQKIEREEKVIIDETTIEPKFVLPGGNRESAQADLTRAVCRRVERSLVELIRGKRYYHLHESQHYINRLSDYLFVLARCLH